jgi:hypothetical protein
VRIGSRCLVVLFGVSRNRDGTGGSVECLSALSLGCLGSPVNRAGEGKWCLDRGVSSCLIEVVQ